MNDNRVVRLASYPQGVPNEENFTVRSEALGEIKPGELLVRVEYVSLNPAMRNWISDGTVSSRPTLSIGDVMRAEAVGRVEASRDENYTAGDALFGMFGVRERTIVPAKHVVPIDETIAPARSYLGVLGLQGLSAYFGIRDLAQIEAGETVVVSGAAGAVGNVAGQLARQLGGKVIGIAGGQDKVRRVVEELGFDAAIDYRSEDAAERLGELAPEGVDVYFDNVGGPILDDVLASLAIGGRIVLCGATSQYNDTGPMRGPSNYFELVYRRARMEGFLITDYAKEYSAGRQALGAMLKEGKIQAHEQILGSGIDAFPGALVALFGGENFGKALLEL